MPRARILKSAIADLDEIWLYIARDNVDAAERLIARIEGTAEKLARFPGLGKRRDELQQGVRSFGVGKYIIFYRRIRGGIEVIHVVHGARGLGGFFPEETEETP